MKICTFRKKIQQVNIPRRRKISVLQVKLYMKISFNFTWQNVFDIETCCNKYL